MRLYILDNDKIVKFDLPEKVEEYFLIKHNFFGSNNESTITVEAENGKWYLVSNVNVNVIFNNSTVLKEVIEDYSCHNLKILNSQENILLYALPSNDINTTLLDISKTPIINIGNGKDSHIFYNLDGIDELHCQIKLEDKNWMLYTNSNDVYVNNFLVNKKELKIGDVIFVRGLKIIWMGRFIKINNPNRLVTIRGIFGYQESNEYNINNCRPVSEEENNIDLYNDDDYFYHLPRIRNVLEIEEVLIDPPPTSQLQEELPFILTLGSSLTMSVTSMMSVYNIYSSVSEGKTTLQQSLPSIITCGAMIVGSLIFPKITQSYQKRRRKSKEKKRQRKYKEYLNSKKEELELILKKQTQILNENNPTTLECVNILQKKDRTLWSREVTHDDFLQVRLGKGDRPAFINVSAPEKHFTLDEDNLIEMVYDVVNNSKTLIDVPITLSFVQKNVISFVCSCSYKNQYINNLIMQLAILQSAIDLKIVIFTNKNNEKYWEYAKFLPHCWSDDKQVRFFATSPDEIKEVSSYLEQEYKNRKEILSRNDDSEEKSKDYKDLSPYYLVITDNYKQAKNAPIVDLLLNQSNNLGFSFVAIGNSMKDLPNKCDDFIELCEKESCILEKDVHSQNQQIFINECEFNIDVKRISVSLSNIPIITKDGMQTLPNTLSFLEMNGVSKIEQLGIVNRWKNNNPVTSLSTPIGVHTNGEQFNLDLHEKFHGPHGLIAGSTGSGKSEFIITYILSMACNYHPYEVQFVLIDYKGGGLAGAFENKETGVRLPHLVGTITNLDTAEMNRTLVSIQSELKRRQRKFNEVKDQLGESTIDIYKYQRFYREGLIKEPMAHLFIISDEFAELKSQQPEFLQELVSTARIGRSLGVHLILATQKPSGVVNDQIWSNSKFKVCLKVQDRSDSMEMLKRPEAASIKETGRFYLQVGYDDYFDIGQSGWGGAKYIPSDFIRRKVDNSINFVNNVGSVVKSINELEKKDTNNDQNLGDQLTNIVKYLHNISVKENLVEHKMWLDAIPEKIYVANLWKKYNYKPIPYLINPLIGEYDNPKSQEQGLLNIKLSGENTLIYGENGSGKENLITTLLYSSSIEHTPDEINFYIIDCGTETLRIFNKVPHIGEIATTDESDKIMSILQMIDEEAQVRKDLFADFAGNYQNYIENSGRKLPQIVLIINNYEIFNETYSKIADALTTLYRDCPRYGISFIISCVTTNSVRVRVAQNFGNKLALRLPDSNDYRNVVKSPKGLVPAKFFGRGLVEKDDTAYEFQTAFVCEEKDINRIVQATGIQQSNYYSTKAKKIASVPDVVYLNTISDKLNGLDSVPIGYETSSKKVFNYNFTENKTNIIIGQDVFGETTFVNALIKLLSMTKDINLKVIDFTNSMKEIDGIKVVKENLDREFAIINNEVVDEKNSLYKNVYVILGIGNLKEKLSEKGYNIANNIFLSIDTFQKTYFILIDNLSSMKKLQIEEWYKSKVNNTNGIWLGKDIGTQMLINMNDLTMNDRKLAFPYLGFVINKGNHIVIKHVVDNEENKDEK